MGGPVYPRDGTGTSRDVGVAPACTVGARRPGLGSSETSVAFDATFAAARMVQRGRDYLPGERLPGTVYVVVRLIGAGGMGTVYDVEDTTISKRYVLKTLHPQLGAREDLARRMRDEARTLAKLNHPNIVEVITAGLTGD